LVPFSRLRMQDQLMELLVCSVEGTGHFVKALTLSVSNVSSAINA